MKQILPGMVLKATVEYNATQRGDWIGKGTILVVIDDIAVDQNKRFFVHLLVGDDYVKWSRDTSKLLIDAIYDHHDLVK